MQYIFNVSIDIFHWKYQTRSGNNYESSRCYAAHVLYLAVKSFSRAPLKKELKNGRKSQKKRKNNNK